MFTLQRVREVRSVEVHDESERTSPSVRRVCVTKAVRYWVSRLSEARGKIDEHGRVLIIFMIRATI